jgi:ACS family hexuronate transporter-like MFS transporter
MFFSMAIGLIVERFGYGPAFLIAGLLHPLSFLLIFFIIKKIERPKLKSLLTLHLN